MQEEDKKYVNLRNLVFILLTGAALTAVAITYVSRQNATSGDEYGLASVAGSAITSDSSDTITSTAQAREIEPGIAFDQVSPSFDVVRISRSGTGVIAGRAAPHSMVQIIADQQSIGSVLADAAGEWVLILQEPLKSGPAELSLLATLNEDSENESADVVIISVPENKGERFVESERDGVVAILTPRDGNGASRILQKPGLSPIGEFGDRLSIDTVDYGGAGSAMISGRALPRAQVALYVDNQFIGTALSDDQGRWSLGPKKSIAKGSHVLRADQVVAEGDVELRIEQPFETDRPADFSRQQSKIMVRSGNSLWHIARKVYGAGYRYTMIFQQNAEQIRDPDLIYPGQLFTLPQIPREALNRGG